MLALLLLSACSPGSDKTESESSSEGKSDKKSKWGSFSQPTLVETYKVQKGAVATYQVSTGRLEAIGIAPVYARVSEVLRELNADVGDYVKKDQVLAQLNSSKLEQELKKSKSATVRARKREKDTSAEFDKLKGDYERRSKGAGEDTTSLFSADEIREAKLAMDSAEIAMDVARQETVEAEANEMLRQIDVNNCTIKAPIEGYVVRRAAEPFSLLSQDSEIFNIAQLGKMKLEVEVPESIMPALFMRVLSGEKPAALLQTTAHPGLAFLGEVSKVAPIVNPESGMIQVTLLIVNAIDAVTGGVVSMDGASQDDKAKSAEFSPHAGALLAQFPPPVRKNIARTLVQTRTDAFSLRPGMWVEASIVVKTKPDAVVIPSTAIVGGSVYVVEDGGSAKSGDAKMSGKSASMKSDAKSDAGAKSGAGKGGFDRSKMKPSKKARLVDISAFIGMRGEGFTEILPEIEITDPATGAKTTKPNDALREGMVIVWRGMEYLKDGGKVTVVQPDAKK